MFTSSEKNKKTILAFFCVALSSICFGISPIFVKELNIRGMDTLVNAFYRMILSSVFAFTLAAFNKQSFRITKSSLLSILFFGIIGYGFTVVLLPTSYTYIPMGMATMCHFSYPILISIAMILLFHDKCTAEKIVAMLFAACGLFFLIKANGESNGNILGILIAVSSGITYGVFVVSQEKTAMSQVNAYVLTSYVSLVCALFFYFILKIRKVAIPLPHGIEWLHLAGASLLSTIAVVLLNTGVRVLGASTAAFINMLEPITNLLADLILYKVIPNNRQWIGSSLMLSSIFLICISQMRKRDNSTRQ